MSYRNDFNQAQRDTYWSIPRIALLTFTILLAFYIIAFVVTGGDLFIYRFWQPKVENAKRQVFENTQSYVQGKTEYISKLRFQYKTVEQGSAQQTALRELILSEASTVDNDKLPMDIQSFISSLKAGIR
jgi:hypothetical protein